MDENLKLKLMTMATSMVTASLSNEKITTMIMCNENGIANYYEIVFNKLSEIYKNEN